ncbi:TlpA disulfide reductase family protein [Taibaiella chishuiensis]|uniref:Thioredoxin n=1 Tax=Taibaiella chishuiensis TaxID=1434707 RepID=A0A2P8CY01_9BACT|nr:TlpA disulfide reductase family protein [Taibaiella chishuiensis]PSK89845.1 thioredoxin [Taibaiella chishuiensis]
MKKCIPVLLLILTLFTTRQSFAQKSIPAYDSKSFLERVSNPDTLYIVNFWATWCIPCVKELPAFDIIHDLYKGKPVKVLLMSFDFREQYPAKLESWVKKKKIHSEVAWFSESNPNDYIPKIAPEWEGALPATLLINNSTGKREVLGREITADELKQWIATQPGSR